MLSEFSIAVHALVYLNRMRTASSEQIAKNVCTNPARIRKVMTKLCAFGLVGAKQGQKGGYFMVLQPECITLDLVADAIGFDPIVQSWRSGDLDLDCVIASGMAQVMDALYAELNKTCKKKLGLLSIKELDEELFSLKPKNECEKMQPLDKSV
ncbi:MAG TPA: Rrf2 family transcriptional regulator [Clostridia bacterium]|nr:MAG: Transcriptional regulator [Firmicutes bacterium ADurb.Bin356]HOF93938.1 Rrf2 family transcriptional regulator [Clostridia bacterium]HOR13727.1 Rrf2 family transcriptional regulator [Clostridia bacterium]